MAIGRAGRSEASLRTLWSAGAIGEADDAALIARFAGRRDEAAEAAFRVLVERHGPMVQRVCRQVIGDGHAAQDASQAVFLVLARKAGSIRVRDTVAPWLHGVARRVAAKARSRASGRRALEAKSAAHRENVSDVQISDPEPPADWAAVHDEVGRLPEKYRTPVVLCYLEGQTYEEAARRIGCPVGTVRVRLSRARDRLRDRLARRGFGPSHVASFGWLAEVPRLDPLGLATPGSVDATVKLAVAYVSGRAAVLGAVSSPALALSGEVLRSMTIAKLKFLGAGFLSLGVLTAGARGLVGRTQKPENNAPHAAPAPAKKTADPPPHVDRHEELAQRSLKAALQRLKDQKTFYEEGRITIDRFLEACDQVANARIRVAKSTKERIAAAQENVEIHGEVLKRETAELEIGRGTAADLSEVTQRLEAAQLRLLDMQEPNNQATLEAMERRLTVLERKLDRIVNLLTAQGLNGKPILDLNRGDLELEKVGRRR